MSRETETITHITCDGCGCDLKDSDKFAALKSMDLCVACLTELRGEVEKAWHRVVKNEVPTRRGGYRTLGEYDG